MAAAGHAAAARAGRGAAARTKGDPGAVRRAYALAGPARVRRGADRALEVDAPVKVRCARRGHHAVVAEHPPMHCRMGWFSTRWPCSVAIAPVQAVVSTPHHLRDVHVGHMQPTIKHRPNAHCHIPGAVEITQRSRRRWWRRRRRRRRWRRWRRWRWRWKRWLVAVRKPALSAISGGCARLCGWWCWAAWAGPTLAVAGAWVSFPSSTLAERLVLYGRAERHPRWTGCRWWWRRGHAGADGPFAKPTCTRYIRMTVAEEEAPTATTCPHGVVVAEAPEPSS